MWAVQEGFGPVDEGLHKCWGVRRTRMKFQTEAEAERFSERRYERMVSVYQRSQSDLWKSYWTRTVKA